MKLEKKVGRFTVETWTDGWPMWVKIHDGDKEVMHGLLPEDVTDLQFALDRIQALMAPHLAKHRD